MTRLRDDVFSEDFETLRLSGGVDRALSALHREFFPAEGVAPAPVDDSKNPHEMSVEDTLTALRRASEEEGWVVTDDDYQRLTATAPEWPKGRDAFRSLRIRFDEGDDGVTKTCEAHATRIKRVFADNYWRWEYLLSGEEPFKGKPVDRLRLLNGNDTHHAVIEWVIIDDLSGHRQRESITAVRGPLSLADEGLVIAWLFPNRVKTIDYDKVCAWFLAGYELNVPERVGGPWQGVPCVDWYRGDAKVGLDASWHSYDDSGCSVPLRRE
jgi:hypothetical protein